MSQHSAAQPTLTVAVRQVAACPCTEHQVQFLDALARTPELLFQAAEAMTAYQDGHPVGEGETLRLVQVTAQGQKFLICYPDVESARNAQREGALVGIQTGSALVMVLGTPELDGLMVNAIRFGDEAFAAASREAIAEVVRERFHIAESALIIGG